MKKRILALFSVLFLVVVLAACGSGGDGGESGGKSADDSTQFRVAGQSPDDHPSTQSLYKFAEELEAQTDGSLTAKIFPANQLGDYTTVYKEVSQGTIDMALLSLPGELDDRLRLNFVPYLVEGYFTNIEEVIGYDSYVFNTLQEVNNEQNVQLLGFHANGFGGVGSTKEIPNLLDFGADKNMLLRVAPDDVFKQPMADIGFRTVTIPFADLYTSLQTGAADGWAGGEPSLNYLGYRDVIKYFYQTNDFFNADAFIINKELFDSLTDEEKDVIQNLAQEMLSHSLETAENDDREYREKLAEEGIEVIEFSEEELSELAQKVKETTWPKLKKTIGEEIMDKLIDELVE